jgi:UDP-N-acetylmuramyl pentapeptide phosphotransferase/UDP-N-acetylglucosamine-1-phosphate transferase
MTLDSVHIILLLVCAFVLTYTLVPRIIGVALYKRLMDKPNERSSHERLTPNIGGVAFYICLMISFYFLDHVDRYNSLPSFLPGLTILFIIGLKDDLTVLSARTKFISQILACLFVLFHYKFEIYSLNGFMGINNLNSYVAGILALFLMLSVINAYNLIDGIDGLASIIGLIILILFGTIFFLAKAYLLMGLCLVLIGSLSAFLRYNFSNKRKIFMGDTGTLVVGFVIAAMTIRLLSLPVDRLDLMQLIPANLPVVTASILIVPLFDMTRVFIIRIIQGKGPFSPDRNHIHHLLIDKLALSHVKASLSLGAFNLMFASVFIYLSIFTHPHWLLTIFLSALLVLTLVLAYIKNGKILTKKKGTQTKA